MKLLKTISILIVCFTSSAPILMPAYFIASRFLIRHEMMERMEKQNLSAILVPVEEFRWYEEGKEIIVDGKMFDVKSIRLDDGTYYITGLFDEQETELELTLEKKMEGSNLPQLLVQVCTSIADLDSSFFNIVVPEPVKDPLAGYYSPHFPKYCAPIVTPPPKTRLT